MKNWKIVVLALSLGLLTLAAFLPSLPFGFQVYDDDLYAFNNPAVRSGLSWPGLGYALTTRDGAGWMPLTWLSLMLNTQLLGAAPWGYRLVNLLLHAGSVSLLFLALRRMTGSAGASVFVAACFAIHPLRIESVVWIAERKDVLSMFFGLLAIWLYAGYAEAPSRRRMAGVAVAMALSLLAKATFVTLPVLLLLLDYWPLGRGGQRTEYGIRNADYGRRKKESWGLLVAEKAPLWVLGILFSVIALAAQAGGRSSAALRAPLDVWVLRILISHLFYLSKLLWPSALTVIYPGYAGVSLVGGVLAVGILGLFTWAAVRNADRYPYFLMGWCWYVVALLPVSGLVPVGHAWIANRYAYLPTIGILVLAAWLVRDVLRERRWRKLAPFLAVAVLAGYGTAFARALPYWRNSVVLFQRAVQLMPRSHAAWNNLGVALDRAGYKDDAVIAFARALQLAPNHISALVNLGALSLARKDHQTAFDLLAYALSLEPENPVIINSMGVALMGLERPEEAVRHFRKAAALEPRLLDARFNLGMALLAQGEAQAAEDEFRYVISRQPGHHAAQFQLASLLLPRGDAAGAVAALESAVQRAPTRVDYLNAYAHALAAAGRCVDAETAYRQALALAPESASTQNNLAWLLATARDAACRKPAEALDLAERASRSTGSGNASVLDTLAAAHAATGNRAKAVENARKALALASKSGDTKLIAAIRTRLDTYRRGGSWVE